MLRLLLLTIVLVAITGGVFLVTWDIPAPTRQVEVVVARVQRPVDRELGVARLRRGPGPIGLGSQSLGFGKAVKLGQGLLDLGGAA